MSKFSKSTRIIDRVIRVFRQAFNTIQLNATICTSDGANTVIRFLLTGAINMDAGIAASGNGVAVLYKLGKGVAVPTVSVAHDTDLLNNQIPNVLWSGSYGHEASEKELHALNVDIKGMRKMKDGDRIMLSTKSSAGSIGILDATVLILYKD